MDNEFLQLLILDILDTEEYTLEGIALYTRLPFDVIFEIACGIATELSIKTSVRIIYLYIQIKPELSKIFFDKLIEFKEKNPDFFSRLLFD